MAFCRGWLRKAKHRSSTASSAALISKQRSKTEKLPNHITQNDYPQKKTWKTWMDWLRHGDMDGRLKIPKDQASMFFRGVKRVVGPSELRNALGLRPQRKGKPERNDEMLQQSAEFVASLESSFFVLVLALMTFVFKHWLLCAVGPCSSSSAAT